MGERGWHSSRYTIFLCLTSLITSTPSWLADELQSYSSDYQGLSFLLKRWGLIFIPQYGGTSIQNNSSQHKEKIILKLKKTTLQHSKCTHTHIYPFWMSLPGKYFIASRRLRVVLPPQGLSCRKLRVRTLEWCSGCLFEPLILGDHHGHHICSHCSWPC